MLTKIILLLVILTNGSEYDEKPRTLKQILKNFKKQIVTAYEQVQNIGKIGKKRNERREQILKSVIVQLEMLEPNDERERAIKYLKTEDEELVMHKNLPHKRPPKQTNLVKAIVAFGWGFLYLKDKLVQAIDTLIKMKIKAVRLYKHRPSLYQIIDSPETVLPSWIIKYKVFTFDWIVRWMLILIAMNNYHLFPGQAAFAIQIDLLLMYTLAELTWRIMLLIPITTFLLLIINYFAKIRYEPLDSKTEMQLQVLLSTIGWFLSFYIIFYQFFYHLFFPGVFKLVCAEYYAPSTVKFLLDVSVNVSLWRQYLLIFLWSCVAFDNSHVK